MTEAETTKSLLAGSFSTTLRRARCARPVLLERMMASLQQHGQLTPLVCVARENQVEVVDGFKRLEAAQRLGLKTLTARMCSLDEVSQWSAMLMLNRGPQSMTELEEALVIRELLKTLSQVEIGQLVHRHKSWVSRRVGLVERLHPELVEQIRTGVLHPGVARRLLALPPGNQLQLAAAAQSARLQPRDTELLVRLWQHAPDAEIRKALLLQPVPALRMAFPQHAAQEVDRRLSAAGQRLSRTLWQVRLLAEQALRMLPASQADAELLGSTLTMTEQVTCLLSSRLGSNRNGAGADGNGGRSATSSSS